MSKRGGGGGIATVTLGLCDATMIEGIKTIQPEVKASKSDKRLRSYGRLKFYMVFHGFYLGLQLMQPPSRCCAYAYL